MIHRLTSIFHVTTHLAVMLTIGYLAISYGHPSIGGLLAGVLGLALDTPIQTGANVLARFLAGEDGCVRRSWQKMKAAL